MAATAFVSRRLRELQTWPAGTVAAQIALHFTYLTIRHLYLAATGWARTPGIRVLLPHRAGSGETSKCRQATLRVRDEILLHNVSPAPPSVGGATTRLLGSSRQAPTRLAITPSDSRRQVDGESAIGHFVAATCCSLQAPLRPIVPDRVRSFPRPPP